MAILALMILVVYLALFIRHLFSAIQQSDEAGRVAGCIIVCVAFVAVPIAGGIICWALSTVLRAIGL